VGVCKICRIANSYVRKTALEVDEDRLE